MKPEIAVVILNWNGKNLLETYLPSVVEFSNEAIIYLADNGSTDESVNFVETTYPNVRIIRNYVNEGFAKGYNYALNIIDADYYVLLNSDVEVSKNWLNAPLKLLKSNPLIAACQPKILSYHSKDTFEYAGAAGGWIDYLGYPFCKGRIFDNCEKDSGQYNSESEIFWASGACMFVRASSFKKVGGLDNDFFAHMEEIDLCWRLKNAGYKIMFTPHSTVFHLGGGTLQKSNPKKTFLNFRNGLAMLYKNLPIHKLGFVIIIRLFLDGLAGIKFILNGSFADGFAIIKAHFSFYANLRLWQQKRKQTQIQSVAKTSSGIFNESIVWNYYVKKRTIFTKLIIK